MLHMEYLYKNDAPLLFKGTIRAFRQPKFKKKKKNLNQFLFQENFSIVQSFLRTLIGIAEIIDFYVVPMFYPSDIFIYL